MSFKDLIKGIFKKGKRTRKLSIVEAKTTLNQLFSKADNYEKKFSNPYLVQRLQEPQGGHGMFPFGGGGNGGFSVDAMKLLASVFTFDYMGAAEYEFGAAQQTVQALQYGLVSGLFKVGHVKIECQYYKNNEKFYKHTITPTTTKTGKPRNKHSYEAIFPEQYPATKEQVRDVYFICLESMEEGLLQYLHDVINFGDYDRKHNINHKCAPRIQDALNAPAAKYFRPTKYAMRELPLGWLDFNNHTAFFKDVNMFVGFVLLVCPTFKFPEEMQGLVEQYKKWREQQKAKESTSE